MRVKQNNQFSIMQGLVYRLKMGTKMVTGPKETKLVWKMRQHPCIFLSFFGYGDIFLLTYLENTFSQIKKKRKKCQAQSALH